MNESNSQSQNPEKPKKVTPPGLQQVSLKEYKELHQRELERRKKKKQLPLPLTIIIKLIYFVLAGFGIFIIGFFAFSFIKAIISG